MVERTMRDLKSSLSIMIRACAEGNHKDWDKFIPFFQMSHNSNESEVTHTTPANVFLGRPFPRPIDRQWKLDRYLDVERSPTEEEVRQRIQEVHDKVKTLYDLRHPRQQSFRVGQLVVQRRHDLARPGDNQGQKFIPLENSIFVAKRHRRS